MRLQHGGVGWYPSANFVHLDVGGVRSWPRMSYDELARLFPDGKTVHVIGIPIHYGFIGAAKPASPWTGGSRCYNR